VLADLHDGSATEYVINDMPAGTYYFAVTTYDSAGQKSQRPDPVEISTM